MSVWHTCKYETSRVPRHILPCTLSNNCTPISSLTTYGAKHQGKFSDSPAVSQQSDSPTYASRPCLSMTVLRRGQARTGIDKWSLFLRQRRLKDQLRRLKNDFKSCYCPPGCRGGPQNYVAADAASLPPQDLHGPYVPVDGVMPRTFGRTELRKDPECRILAEARGTSDILLYRNRTRATLRMSLQVHTDPHQPGILGYYGEMFLTQPTREERFIGFVHSWHVDRATRNWETLYLNRDGWEDDTEFASTRRFIKESYGYNSIANLDREQNGNLLPAAQVQRCFGARWAGLTDDTDIVYISMIWVHENVCACILMKQLYYFIPVDFLPVHYSFEFDSSALTSRR